MVKWLWAGVLLGVVIVAMNWDWPPTAPRRLGVGFASAVISLAGLFGARFVRISREKMTLVYAIGRLPLLRSSIAVPSVIRIVPESELRSHLIRVYGRKRGEMITLDGFVSADERDEYLALVKTRLRERGADIQA